MHGGASVGLTLCAYLPACQGRSQREHPPEVPNFMSAYIAPLLWVHGVVRAITEREVPEVPPVAFQPARPASYGDQGQIIDPGAPEVEARPGRPAYICHDVVIDTQREGATVAAGFIEVVITPRAAESTGGYLPTPGESVEWPIRGYQKWYGTPGRRRSTNGYSFAGDVYAAAQKSPASGRRVESVPA